jgi:hypothetical protein
MQVSDCEACQDVSGGRRGDVARPQQTRQGSACYAGGAPDALRMARGGRSRAERARSHPQTPLFLGLKRHGARPNQARWPAAHWPHYNTWRHLHGASMARPWREHGARTLRRRGGTLDSPRPLSEGLGVRASSPSACSRSCLFDARAVTSLYWRHMVSAGQQRDAQRRASHRRGHRTLQLEMWAGERG